MRNAIIALIWANLSFTDCYFSLWNSKGGSVLQVLSFTNLYLHWINDLLIAILLFCNQPRNKA